MRETLAYFDTSVVVKWYVAEPGSALARRLIDRHTMLSSALTPVELLSALRRRQSRRELTHVQVTRILRDVREDRPHWWLLDVHAAILARAEQLLEHTALRTLDALHVASARGFEEIMGTPLPFVTADARQREAAMHSGLDVVWVA